MIDNHHISKTEETQEIIRTSTSETLSKIREYFFLGLSYRPFTFIVWSFAIVVIEINVWNRRSIRSGCTLTWYCCWTGIRIQWAACLIIVDIVIDRIGRVILHQRKKEMYLDKTTASILLTLLVATFDETDSSLNWSVVVAEHCTATLGFLLPSRMRCMFEFGKSWLNYN